MFVWRRAGVCKYSVCVHACLAFHSFDTRVPANIWNHMMSCPHCCPQCFKAVVYLCVSLLFITVNFLLQASSVNAQLVTESPAHHLASLIALDCGWWDREHLHTNTRTHAHRRAHLDANRRNCLGLLLECKRIKCYRTAFTLQVIINLKWLKQESEWHASEAEAKAPPLRLMLACSDKTWSNALGQIGEL